MSKILGQDISIHHLLDCNWNTAFKPSSFYMLQTLIVYQGCHNDVTCCRLTA